MGLQNYQTRSDRRNTILIGIWDGGYHLGRHQHANNPGGSGPTQNDALLHLMLDHLKERCQQAQIRIIAYQQQIWVSHNKKARPREFQVRDLVLKRVI